MANIKKIFYFFVFLDGCHCEPGWFGQNCSDMCPESRYGINCSRECECLHGAQCDPITGSCHCSAGYTGRLCESGMFIILLILQGKTVRLCESGMFTTQGGYVNKVFLLYWEVTPLHII